MSPGVPRSPHQRELPPSLEPGLWAGDEPRASRKREPALPELFGVLLPGHDTPATQAANLARVCVDMWNNALPGTGLGEKVNALRPAARRCVVAWMFDTCARVFVDLDAAARERGVLMPWKRRDREALQREADAFTGEACKEVRLTPEQFRLLEKLRAAVYTSLDEPE